MVKVLAAAPVLNNVKDLYLAYNPQITTAGAMSIIAPTTQLTQLAELKLWETGIQDDDDVAAFKAAIKDGGKSIQCWLGNEYQHGYMYGDDEDDEDDFDWGEEDDNDDDDEYLYIADRGLG